MDNQPNQPNQPTPQPMPPTTGLSINAEAALSYVLGFITGIYFYVTSKDKYVRFHAMQSIVLSVVIIIIDYLLPYIPVLGYVLMPLFSLACFILWLFMIYKAYHGERYKLPIVGDFAEKKV